MRCAVVRSMFVRAGLVARAHKLLASRYFERFRAL
jgi:hypothetical protein